MMSLFNSQLTKFLEIEQLVLTSLYKLELSFFSPFPRPQPKFKALTSHHDSAISS